MTVLFADLVGFTARAEQLDPEDVRAILRVYYARLRTEIESFGGTVEKFIGDAVMAVFGAPIAHGDDPERAVRAAFSIRTAIAEMNAASPDLDLQVRMAVNTGEAIVSLGAKPDEGEGMVAGDVVNTASRLQSSAPVNEILVGEETHRCTRTVIEYRDFDALTVKGKQHAVRAWLALRATSTPGERVMRSASMVGRRHELTTLHRIWEGAVAERRPHLVTVIGETGIGKTRLATELCALVEQEGGQILLGRVLPYGVSTLYGPFSQHVKQLADIFASNSIDLARTKLRDTVSALVDSDSDDVVGHIEMLIELETEGEVTDRRVLFFSARQLVEAIANERPTVMVFEDLHWADDNLLDLVEALAARVRGAPLLMLALARPDLLASRPGWGGGLPAATALHLQPLDAVNATELASRLLAEMGAAEHSGDPGRIVDTAEGNPLFIEELAATLAELPDSDTRALPATVREIIAARLDGLPGPERALVLDAAVVGKTFWRGALAHLGFDSAKLTDALDSLEARDLIHREPSSWIERDHQYSFKHGLIREVAYASIPRLRRRESHAAVAAYLEQSTSGGGATATALAQHWREAGDNERAIKYLIAAAELAGRGWAKDEAVALYKEAFDLAPADNLPLRRDLAKRQAIAQQILFHVTDAQLLGRETDPFEP